MHSKRSGGFPGSETEIVEAHTVIRYSPTLARTMISGHKPTGCWVALLIAIMQKATTHTITVTTTIITTTTTAHAVDG